MSLARVGCALLTALLVACDDPAPAATLRDGGASPFDVPSAFDLDASTDVPVELGTGLARWEPLPPSGGSVELVRGPQGGHHVLARVRFGGFAPDVYLSFRVLPVEGGMAVNATWERVRRFERRGLDPFEGGFETTAAELVVMAVPGLPASVVGRRFRLQVAVQEVASGRVAIAEREVTVVDREP